MSDLWDEALDAFGAHLAELRTALRQDGPKTLLPFTPPPSLGPLPPHRRREAEVLLRQAAEVQAQLGTALAETGREVEVVRRLIVTGPDVPGPPRYVDRTI